MATPLRGVPHRWTAGGGRDGAGARPARRHPPLLARLPARAVEAVRVHVAGDERTLAAAHGLSWADRSRVAAQDAAHRGIVGATELDDEGAHLAVVSPGRMLEVRRPHHGLAGGDP